LDQISTDIAPRAPRLPASPATAVFARYGAQPSPLGDHRAWPEFDFAWEASSFAHQPLYFQEINLERYGYTHGITQPLYSAARFYGTIPALHYLIAANKPNELIYTHCYYRPGSDAPLYRYNPPTSIKGGIVEAGVMTGIIFLFP